jgi:predicted alpha/beta-hydrolase family hydrolase
MYGDAEEVTHYRLRAEVLRTIAATTKDRVSREVLLNVAHDQELRAQAREAIAKWDNKASSRKSA